MRVLHLINSLGTGGAESLLLEVVRSSRDDDDLDIEIVTLFTDDHGFMEQVRSEGIRVHELNAGKWRWDRGTRRLIRLLRRVRPDVVHTHLAPAHWVAALVRPLFPRTPFVHTVHNVHDRRRGPVIGSVQRRVLRAFDRVVACGEEVGRAQRAFAPELADRVVVVRNGIRPPDVPGAQARADARRAAGLAPEQRFFLFIGRLGRQKAVDVLLPALEQVPGDMPVVLCGDGEDREALERQARELGVADRARFLGRMPRDVVMALLTEADAMVLPSRWEGMPMVTIEALLLGTPVLGSAVGEIPHMVRDGVDGLVFAPEDRHALTAALTHVVEHPEEVRAWRQALRDRPREYTVDQHIDELKALYRSLARTRRRQNEDRVRHHAR